GDDRAVDACLRGDFLDRVVDRHTIDVAPAPSRRHATDDFRAVIEALTRHADGLAPGDTLNDEGRVFGDQNRHGATFTQPSSWPRRGPRPRTSRPYGRSSRRRNARGS